MSEKAKCAKCGKELNVPKSENWEMFCGACITPKELLERAKRKKK